MPKVKITKAPSGVTGSQADYGLVRRLSVSSTNESERTVKNTMTELKGKDKAKAKIEVEDGETVLGDINRDGYIELFEFKGKRHSEGGMAVDIPEGSFIFSDTNKLKIRDKDVLKEYFGLNYKNGGYTPAEISKKYQINEYIDTLKNVDLDELTKRTANEMLKNNMQKLGILAFLQEAMKGFPDGLPDIAQLAFQQLNVSPEELMPQQQPSPEEMQMMMAQQQGQAPQQMMQAPPEMMGPPPQDMAMDMGQSVEQPMMMGRYGGTLPMYQTAGTVKPLLTETVKSNYKPGNFSDFSTWQDMESWANQSEAHRTAILKTNQAFDAILKGDYNTALKLSDDINSTDIENSWGWLGWSDQDEVDNMAGNIKDEIAKKIKQNLISEVSTVVNAFDQPTYDNLVNTYRNKINNSSGEKQNLYIQELEQIKKAYNYLKNSDNKFYNELVATDYADHLVSTYKKMFPQTSKFKNIQYLLNENRPVFEEPGVFDNFTGGSNTYSTDDYLKLLSGKSSGINVGRTSDINISLGGKKYQWSASDKAYFTYNSNTRDYTDKVKDQNIISKLDNQRLSGEKPAASSSQTNPANITTSSKPGVYTYGGFKYKVENGKWYKFINGKYIMLKEGVLKDRYNVLDNYAKYQGTVPAAQTPRATNNNNRSSQPQFTSEDEIDY